MSGAFITTLWGSARFEHSDEFDVARSVAAALKDLREAATYAGAEVIWSTVSLSFDFKTFEDSRVDTKYAQIVPALSTVLAKASVVIRPQNTG